MLPFTSVNLIISTSILLLKELVPVNIVKEVVRLDSGGTVCTKTLVIEIKQVHQKIPSNTITAREGHRLMQDRALHHVDCSDRKPAADPSTSRRARDRGRIC